MTTRADMVRRNRPRGLYVPTAEAQTLLHCGWELVDDCPPPLGVKAAGLRDEVLLAPPAAIGEVA